MNEFNFSVLICVYKNDNSKYFKEALDSIYNQSLKPSEIVLVIDGYIPRETEEVISSFSGVSILKIVRLKENMGHGIARRMGIEACSNDIIALMDADDISVKTRFEKQIPLFVANSSLSVLGSNIDEFEENIHSVIAVRKVPETNEKIKEYLKKRCPFNQMTVCIRKNMVQQVGGYLDWYHNEDYYLWIRLHEKGFQFKNLNESLVKMRVSNELYKRRGGKKYFFSEYRLQKYMLNKRIINNFEFLDNVIKRFVLQILVPNNLRAILFKKFAREKYVGRNNEKI